MAKSIKNLISACLIAFSLFWIWTDIVPRRSYTSRLKPIVEERIAMLETRRNIVKKMGDLQSEFQNRYAEFQRLALLLPPTENLPEILTTAEAISLGTGNTIKSISIRSVKDVLGMTNSVHMDMAFDNQFAALLILLNHVEKNIRLIDIESLSMIGGADDAERRDILSLSFSGQTRHLKTVDEIRRLQGQSAGAPAAGAEE